jgi:transketolase
MSLDAEKQQKLRDIANRLRIHSIEATNASNSGHPTSCSSMADIVSVLFFNTMRYDPKDPRNASNDRFVLSKGHAAPILYAAWAEAGAFPVSELKNLRKIDNPLEGHPTPVRKKFYQLNT